MKIAIFTLNGYDNHGNRLQNYALEQILLTYGEVHTIFQHNGYYNLENTNFLSIYNESVDKNYEPLSSIIKSKIEIQAYPDSRINRFISFKRFSEENLHEVHGLINEDNILKDFIKEFDVFVVGSDQIWNPLWQKGYENCLLPFKTKKNAKKIAIAASFGVNDLGERQEWYKNYLENFDTITVREFKGIEILNEMGIHAELCLDPTMLLTTEHWLAKTVDLKEKNFILLYFLGELPNDLENFLNDLIKNKEYKIININDANLFEYYGKNPFEFISYIKDAELVLTDSFHGVVFSCIFNTPFLIFERMSNIKSMNSRIETLEKLFGISDRRFETYSSGNVFEYDFSYLNEALKKNREISISKITEIFGIKNKEDI